MAQVLLTNLLYEIYHDAYILMIICFSDIQFLLYKRRF